MGRVDYSATARAYRRARTLPPPVLDAWHQAIGRLELPPARRVLDLGAGPGGFLDPLTAWSGGAVIAVEPSGGMRDAAAGAGLAGRYPYAAAVAEHLPLRSASVDWAWLSTVVHQFDDMTLAADELARVLRRDGRVLLRGFFGDMAITGLFASFPGIERAAAMFPSTDAVTATFGGAGFEEAHVVDVVEPWTFELDAWVTGVRSIRHTDSALRPLTDDEIDEGIRRVRAAHPGDEPLDGGATLRLIVLRR